MEGGGSPSETQRALSTVVRLARVAGLLPELPRDGRLLPAWAGWLADMDEALETAEVAARDDAVNLALALKRLRADLDRAVTGSGATLYVDAEAVETVAVRALRVASGVKTHHLPVRRSS